MDVATTPTAALSLSAVRKTFEATEEDQIPVRALRGVDLEVASGSFASIMGPSGCGKSTLLNLVAGLDGVGFDTRGGSLGVGFQNMLDRLGALGGLLRVESAPGRGTHVTGTLPAVRRD